MLHLDWETFSDLDLKKVGHYKYVTAPRFSILMGGWRDVGHSEGLWVPSEGEELPDELARRLLDPDYPIAAWNAAFERQVISAVFGIRYAKAERFHCVMAHAMYAGMPGDLAQAGPAMGMPLDKQKSADGRKLIQLFCKPAPANRKVRRYDHTTHPEEWVRFKEYCRQDVAAEHAISKKLERHIVFPAIEQKMYWEDQRINDRGLHIDLPNVRRCLTIFDKHEATLTRRAKALTGLDNPKSVTQARPWCLANGMPPDLLPNMQKDTVESAMNRPDVVPDLVMRFLELREQIAASSISKLRKMEEAEVDGFLRGCLQYYGANRTGRWAGRLIQPQNFPRGIFDKARDYAAAIQVLSTEDPELLEWLYDNVTGVIATMIRPMITASPGCRLIVSDLAAIEARVLAWLAAVEWRLEVFRTHGKIYEASAAQTFGLDLQEILEYPKRHGHHHPIRKKGKVSELALGYQGAVGAMITMGALKEGLLLEDLQPMVDRWREANPEVPRLWWDCEAAARECIRNRSTVALRKYSLKRGEPMRPCDTIEFACDGSFMTILLPSGRKLYYRKPKISSGNITYLGVDQKTKRWGVLETYGGKLVENIVQAIARDIIRDQTLELADLGYMINLLVHDEIVADQPIGTGSLAEMIKVMSREIPWAPGLPLGAAGFESPFYYKD